MSGQLVVDVSDPIPPFAINKLIDAVVAARDDLGLRGGMSWEPDNQPVTVSTGDDKDHDWEVASEAREATWNNAYQRIIWEAKSLLSEDGENPEYDRGIVELVTMFLGRSPAEDSELISIFLGVKS